MDEVVGGNAGPEVIVSQETTANPEGTEEAKPVTDKPKRNGLSRKLDRADARIAELEAKIASQPAKTEPEAQKPVWKDDGNETAEQYFERLADWKANEKIEAKFKDRDSKAQEEKLRDAQQAKQADFRAQAVEFAKKTPDYDEAITNYDGPMSPAIEAAILETSPEVVYHLAKNPELADELEGKSYGQVLRILGRVEATLEKSDSPRVSKAPPPIKPVGKGSGGTKPLGELSFQEYKKARAKK